MCKVYFFLDRKKITATIATTIITATIIPMLELPGVVKNCPT